MNPQGPLDGSTSRRKSWRPAAAEDVSIYAVRRYALHAEIGAGRAATVHLGRLLGPEKFARIVAVIIIITTGLTLAFGDTSGGFRRLIQIVFGLSIAFAASSFFLAFFAFGGGVLV